MAPEHETLELPAPVIVTLDVDPAEYARWLATAADERADSVEQWLTVIAMTRCNVLQLAAVELDGVSVDEPADGEHPAE